MSHTSLKEMIRCTRMFAFVRNRKKKKAMALRPISRTGLRVSIPSAGASPITQVSRRITTVSWKRVSLIKCTLQLASTHEALTPGAGTDRHTSILPKWITVDRLDNPHAMLPSIDQLIDGRGTHNTYISLHQKNVHTAVCYFVNNRSILKIFISLNHQSRCC